MLAALLESKLADISMGLGPKSQREYAGEFGSKSSAFIKERLKSYREQPSEMRESRRILEFVNDAAEVLRRRNDVVHRVWLPVESSGIYRGHKAKLRKGKGAVNWTDWGEKGGYTDKQFDKLVAELEDLILRARDIVPVAGALGADKRVARSERSRLLRVVARWKRF